MLEKLSGKKTYLLSAALALYALLGLITGQLDQGKAIELFLQSGIFSAIRAGVAKS